MGYSNGPKLATDGLILALDAADRNSYPGSGTTWTNISGDGINGTLVNGPTFDSNNRGSIIFDATNDRVTISSNNLALGTDDFTVESFCYRDSGSNTYSGLSGGGGSGDGIIVSDRTCWIGTGVLLQGIGNNGTKNFTDNEWIYVIFQRETVGGTTTYRLKENTVDILTPTTYSTPASITSTSIALGQRYNNNFGFPWKGNIATYRLYNRALTQAEILQNYNAIKSRFGL